jgi:hypothetical protein
VLGQEVVEGLDCFQCLLVASALTTRALLNVRNRRGGPQPRAAQNEVRDLLHRPSQSLDVRDGVAPGDVVGHLVIEQSLQRVCRNVQGFGDPDERRRRSCGVNGTPLSLAIRSSGLRGSTKCPPPP